ncbi:hypothetical protein IAT40_003492 [Kwoniella sp. CBS 6097]
MAPPPPSPFHYLRTHHHPLSALHFNSTNALLYSGDQEGWVSILDLKVRRVICYWRAHEGGVLGLEEWEGGLISHGRDNVIHFYEPLKRPYISFSVGSSTGTGNGPERYKTGPPIRQSLPTNALNFCRFSLLPLDDHKISNQSPLMDGEKERRIRNGKGKGKGKGKEREAIMAVPSLTNSELVDIYHIPSLKRIHAAVNYVPKVQAPVKDSVVPENGRSGLVMSLHLRHRQSTSSLTLSIGYEDGRVELYRSSVDLDNILTSQPFDARMSSGPNPWEMVWKGKGHNEAVMGMDVDKQARYGWSVSADHRLVRFDFAKVLEKQTPPEDISIMKDHSLRQIGNSCVTVRPDGRVVAVGGWDGKIRLFSTETFKPLGTLSSHRETVHVIAFANPPLPTITVQDEHEDAESLIAEEEASTLDIADDDESDDEDDDDDEGKGGVRRESWFASGGKDTKVALWGLMDFGGGGGRAEASSGSR